MKEYSCSNISFYNDNYLNLIHKLKQHIVFIDPPWGGKGYKDIKKIRLQLSDVDIEDVCLKILNLNSKPKMIVIKLPINYDLLFLYNKLGSFFDIILYQIKKMDIIVIIPK
jgi:16S rRNA G966 N2-methylase RsmD